MNSIWLCHHPLFSSSCSIHTCTQSGFAIISHFGFAIISCFWMKTPTPKTSGQGFFFGQILTTWRKEKEKIGNFHYFSINLAPKNAKFYNKFRY
jgi:hypothetical protein